MDATMSPTKRRALAPLDANALPVPSPNPTAKQPSPLRDALTPKRALDAPASPLAKKLCVERDEDATRSRSHSPDTSSLFDTSTGDASWATVATDVDMDAMVTRPRAPALTRDQAREKAEILRLRLGLASYKLRTGQMDIPLADLQVRPLPGRVRPASRSTDAAKQDSQPLDDPAAEEEENTDEGHERETDGPPVLLPRLPNEADLKAVQTPQKRRLQDEVRLTSSALRGGAASGLLSLARGEVSE